MENADALDLSKENIQPLKRGRNTAQLGLALQAQTDTSLHQMLSKKQEWYEMQIRTYEGSDPLELWCEYISWVEQSFPKHGPEGNLSLLLTKCFQAFKDEEKYKNDHRFVGLWIKYIEMQSDSKRVELYQLLHTQGIGLTCAGFYRSWAYEFECVGDWKQADHIYKKGSSLMAQPAEELHAAYQQFLASFVFSHRNMNHETQEDEFGNQGQADHRLPMAALKPVGKKSTAPNVRVGSSVRSQLPGVVPTVQGSSGRSTSSSRTFGVRGNNAGPVAVYQQLGDSELEIPHSQIVPSAVPIPQSLNKENIVKAGPWTGQGLASRKHQSTSAAQSYIPRQPGFEVHKDEDEDADAANSLDVRCHGMVVPNVLKPRKALEDGFHDAIAIFEEPNPFTKPMYRKNEVYAGGKEFQLEELHAPDYFRKRAERGKKMREASGHSEHAEQRKSIATDQFHLQSSMGLSQDAYYPPRDTPGSYYGDRQMAVGSTQEHSFRQSCPSGNPAVNVGSAMSSYHQSQPQSMYETASAAEAGAHYGAELPHHEQPHLAHKFQPSNQSMHNQSMTLHTKLAMHEVNNLWGSPTMTKTSACGPALPVSSSTNMYQPAFQIMKDDSLPHQANENSPLNHVELQTFPHNQFHKSKAEVFGTTAHGSNQPSSMLRIGQPDQNHKPDLYPTVSSHNYASQPALYEDTLTMTSYMKQQNGFHVYQEEPYPPVNPNAPVQKEKFQVFCDEDMENNSAPLRTCSAERGDLSSSTHTSGSIHKIAKEKENIHKFPQADIELMEDCGVTPALESPERGIQQQQQQQQHHPHLNQYNMAAYDSQLQNQPVGFSGHHAYESTQPAPVVSHSTMQHAPEVVYNPKHPTTHGTYETMQQASAITYETVQSAPTTSHNPMQTAGPMPNQLIQEPMDDDATVAAAPHYGVNMSETGITEAFFFPKMSAASTPFQTSPKKPRASKNNIDFNSSLYRVEQSWPDEEDDGPEGSNRSPNTPKTVPPLKLFRIKNDGEQQQQQLSAIMEASKEKYQSMLSSSRNSVSSASTFGIHTIQRQSLAPQPCLNQIDESSEQSSPSSSQDGQGQGQMQMQMQVQMQGLDPQLMNDLGMRVAKGEFNPFDSRILNYFLCKMGFPLPHHADGYWCLNGAVPSRRNNCLNLNGDVYTVGKILGEGAYAKVLKAVNASTQQEVALKIQKPSCRWEYYICREIQHRLSQRDLASAFMPADQIYVYNNGSVIVTDLLPFGTLLNLVNKVVASTKRQMTELQVLYLLNQLISAVAALHECKIIHGDLKPDNILIRAIPDKSQVPCIQLIDFGRSIDMTLVPEGTTFNTVVMTDTFTCIEMRTGKPWTYQTDLFGLANTAHCLLLGDYMKVHESRSTGRWTIQARLARNLNSDFWGTFFDTLLNIESCDALPDLETLQADVHANMSSSSQLSLAISSLGSILLSR